MTPLTGPELAALEEEAAEEGGLPPIFRTLHVADGTGRRLTPGVLIDPYWTPEDAAELLLSHGFQGMGRAVTREEEEAMAEAVLNLSQTTDRLRACGMKISREMVSRGIRQRVFPFGDCVTTDDGSGNTCYIYAALLEKWIRERFPTAPPPTSHEPEKKQEGKA